MKRKKVPVATGVSTIGANSMVSAMRRPGMSRDPQNRKPRAAPSTVWMPTPQTTKVKVRDRSSQMPLRELKIWTKLRRPMNSGGMPEVSEKL